MRSRIGIRPSAQRSSPPYAAKSYKTAVVAIPPDHQWWPIQRLRKQYDRHYRRWSLADNVYWLIEQTRFIIEVLGPVLNLNILELACGDGRISRMLMDRGARSVLGTDISEEMIKQAVAQNRDEQGGLVYSMAPAPPSGWS